MSAKGGALGADVPGSGVASNRAPQPRSGSNGAKRRRGGKTGPSMQEAGITDTPGTPAAGISAESVQPAVSSSVRTLILGIDYDGRIVQHDRNAPRILASKAEDLLGSQLSDLTVPPAPGSPAHASSHGRAADGVAAVSALLESVRSEREGSAMLTIETRDGHAAEAVVTVHPMRAAGTSLAALAMLRIPAQREERFVDPALMRRQMLDDTFTRLGDSLDIDHLARELMDALVPQFCNAADLLLLESLAGDDELPAHGPDGSLPMR